MAKIEPKTDVFVITEMTQPAGKEDKCPMVKRRRCAFEHYLQPCLAELLGTSLFVFVGCASVIGNEGNHGNIQPAVAHGLALAVLVVVLGQISGGHFNPAVSLCVYLCGGMEFPLLVPYILVQMFGGMTGAGLAKAIFPSIKYVNTHGGVFTVDPAALGETVLAEVVMTLFLTTVVSMGAINSKTSSPWAPISIGLTVTANILSGGVVSGGCMNPARAFGPAVAAGHWCHHWIFWVGPLCGALITAIFTRVFLGDLKTRLILKCQ